MIDFTVHQSSSHISEMGWEIDHKHPTSKGGTDSSRNLHAVQWEENRSKGNKYPYN